MKMLEGELHLKQIRKYRIPLEIVYVPPFFDGTAAHRPIAPATPFPNLL
jgi:hypothetical protein